MKRALPLLLAVTVGLASLGITAWLWRHEQQTGEARMKASFDAGLRQTTDGIEQRMASYEQMLRGLQGLFTASGGVNRQAFDTYVDALLAGADIAGLQAFAYGPWLPGDQTTAHVAAQRTDGAQGYTINPPGQRDFQVPVTYISPGGGRSAKALGYDVYQDPVRRAALLKARDSGNAAISGRIHLVTEPDQEPQYGFLMVLPLYARGQPLDSIALRRKHLVGWVWAGIRVGDFMSSLYGEGAPGLELRIHDGIELADTTLMYRSGNAARRTAPARFEAEEYIGLAGHAWTLVVRTQPRFEQYHQQNAARIILIAGLGLSLLLACLSYLLMTARERAYGVAHAMTGELRESEVRYRRIVETANEGIWLIDAQQRVSFANAKMLQMLGCTEADLLARPLLSFISEPDHDLARADLERREAAPHEPHDLRFRRFDGTELWVAMSVATIFDADGSYAGALGMLTDITERKQAESRRLALESQLRESQKMEAIGTLAGGIAHDFNNILAAILGNVSMARQQAGASSPALQASLAQIEMAGVRGRSLVQKILAFSRMQPHLLVNQAMRPLVEEAVALLRSTLPASVELDVRLSDAPLQVGADATQVQQILMNLCTNAWHALQGRAGRITIELREVILSTEAAQALGDLRSGPHAHLRVSDTGCGMNEATRARVFEPFFTTKPVGQGTGLGLSVVHGIVTAHRGAIVVESVPGLGSSFHLYLPLMSASDSGAAQTPGATPTLRGQGQHVLYVDDDPAMLLMVKSLLQHTGYRVTTIEHPREAADLVRAQPGDFDLVVTDFNMPELTGMDLALELARIRPGLPVVISSGYVSDDMREAAQRAGVRGLMQKEYTLEQLAEIVHSVLAERPFA
ncbi:MAG: CHASE domain-containing protein [Cytophagales bacterium]|nr:CHASE domain-containing protein [Rhizobacter sp.]